MALEVAIGLLKQQGDREFLSVTNTAMKVLQNILCCPEELKYRSISSHCKFVAKAGAPELLVALGFERKEDSFHYSGFNPENLLKEKRKLFAARRQTGTPLGWDIPPNALQFSRVMTTGKYGDLFQGKLDGEDVIIRTLRPDAGEAGKDAFDRELSMLCKLEHTNVTRLCAVLFTSDPMSLVLEYLPLCLLDLLREEEPSDLDVIRYAKHVALGMKYLHFQDVLHCDLAARNLLVDIHGVVKISNFELSRLSSSDICSNIPEGQLSVRWMSPEVLKNGSFSKQADVWSYGVVLYEMCTAGSIPYANLSTKEVKAQVLDGYRLSQPQGCHDDLYAVILKCWALKPSERPLFNDFIKNHLDPLDIKLTARQDTKSAKLQCEDSVDAKSLQRSKKSKVKELVYSSVAGKGGGLLRVYTALVSVFHRRMVVVCGRKTTLGEVIQTVLAKCNKNTADPKSYTLALVRGRTSGAPTHYLEHDQKALEVKASAPSDAQFVLCVKVPDERALLEVMETIRQSVSHMTAWPAYGSAFDESTQGYLLMKKEEEEVGTNKGTNVREWQRYWCVLDGSTLLCYSGEEVEARLQTYFDFKGCSVSLTSSKKGNVLLVEMVGGGKQLLATNDRADALQWVEAIEVCVTMEPSPLLLHATGGGTVILAGHVECQEFALDSSGKHNPLQAPFRRRLGTKVDFNDSYAAVDYGRHWTVLKNTGLVQCLVDGKPEVLLDLADCLSVTVRNPKLTLAGSDYSIEVETCSSKMVLRADQPSDHSDWSLALEGILKREGREGILKGNRCDESGYMALKRLIMLNTTGSTGGGAGGLYTLPPRFNDMDDIYSSPLPPRKVTSPSTLPLKGGGVASASRAPPTTRSGPTPPPLPPKHSTTDPSCPRRGVSSPAGSSGFTSTVPTDVDEALDEYVAMEPLPATTPPGGGGTLSRSFSISSIGLSSRAAVPTPPSSQPPIPSSQPPIPSSQPTLPSSQPIMVPNRRPSKQSSLLRNGSESPGFTNSPPNFGTSLGESDHFGGERLYGGPLTPVRNNPLGGGNPLMSRDLSYHSLRGAEQQVPPLPPRNGERGIAMERGQRPSVGSYMSSGLQRSNSSLQRSNSSLQRSNSSLSRTSTLTPTHATASSSYSDGGKWSRSEGMMVSEAQRQLSQPANPPNQLYGSNAQMETNHSRSNSSLDSDQGKVKLPVGWERGYCEKREQVFFFNSATGESAWCIQDVFKQSTPGNGWQTVRLERGEVYYYHEVTRETTWDIKDTWVEVNTQG